MIMKKWIKEELQGVYKKKEEKSSKKRGEGKSLKNENSKEDERWENNEEDLTPKVYQSLRAQNLCST